MKQKVFFDWNFMEIFVNQELPMTIYFQKHTQHRKTLNVVIFKRIIHNIVKLLLSDKKIVDCGMYKRMRKSKGRNFLNKMNVP